MKLEALLILLLMAAMAMVEETVYEVLRAHELPKGVRESAINAEGRFEVRLDQACNAKFESELHYDRNVLGTLNYGQIGALSGVSMLELFLWFPRQGHQSRCSSGIIYFDVGVVFKQFSLSLFETPPECVSVRTKNESLTWLFI